VPVCVALSPPRYPINVWWPVPVLHTCRCVWLQSPPRVRCLWLCPRRAVGCVWSCFDLRDNLALRYHPSTRPIPGKLKPSTEFPFIFPSPCRTNHQIPLRPPPPSFTSRPPSHMMEFGVHVLSPSAGVVHRIRGVSDVVDMTPRLGKRRRASDSSVVFASAS